MPSDVGFLLYDTQNFEIPPAVANGVLTSHRSPLHNGARHLVGVLIAGSAFFWSPVQPDLALARIPSDALETLKRIPRAPTPTDLMGAKRPTRKVKGEPQMVTDEDVTSKVKRIMSLMSQAKEASQAEDFEKASSLYSEIMRRYPDLAVTEYARLSHALMQYETGHVSEAILELDDEEVALRGYPEVHAALATILYSERPYQRARSEEQWDLAMDFDERFSDPEWVEKERGWPPKMMSALRKFLTLQ